jgi:predicted porin
MKKSLIALAVMAAAGAASAQSSVTLFGIVDATFNHASADNAAGRVHINRLTNSGYNSSRLGFRGTEDLGGGMAASFWLEAGFNNDDGTGAATNVNNQPSGAGTAPVGTQGLTFNRRSTVSLSSGWGELRLGRDYVPAFWNHTLFDPFGTNGAGAFTNLSQRLGGLAGVPTVTRASNSVGYFLPANLGGIYGQAMYAFGENVRPTVPASTERDGTHIGFRLGYGSGPFNVAAGYGRTRATAGIVTGAGTIFGLTPAEIAAVTAAVSSGKYTNWNLAGSWDFGIARAMAQYQREKVDLDAGAAGSGDVKNKVWLIGALVPVGAGEIRVSYARAKLDDDVAKANQIAIGYVHNLSKRTALYTTFARLNNSGDDANFASSGFRPTRPGGDVRGFDLGVRHSF